MNAFCRMLRRRAAEDGVDTIRHVAAVRQHLEDCAGCRRALDALAGVDKALAALPHIDAPEAAVVTLLEKVAAEQRDELPAPQGRVRTAVARLAGLVRVPTFRHAAAMVAVVVVALMATVMLRPDRPSSMSESALATPTQATRPKLETLRKLGAGKDARDQAEADAGRERLSAASTADTDDLVMPVDELVAEKQEQLDQRKRALQERLQSLSAEVPKPKAKRVPIPDPPSAPQGGKGVLVGGELTEKETSLRRGNRQETESSLRDMPAGSVHYEVTVTAPSPILEERKVLKGTTISSKAEKEKANKKKDAPQPATPEARQDQKARADQAQRAGGFNGNLEMSNDRIGKMRLEAKRLEKELALLGSARASAATASAPSVAAATAYLAERERVAPLAFQPATGYWANTYVPGDPELRRLEALLAEQGLDPLASSSSQPVRLHQHVRPPAQPFDPPKNAAMALYLDADRVVATGPSRTLIQVGLRATDRRGGGRPTLAVAVVLDLAHPADAEAVASMRALLTALIRAAEPGDRFQVFFAGRDTEPLPPEAFRHGALMVALDDALTRPIVNGAHPLRAAIAEADQALLAGGAGDAPLGTSALLLVSARSQPEAGLDQAAHRSALAGVPVSVVAVGAEASRPAHRRLALAGQGRIRALARPDGAKELVDREIDAISQVVARALRLNIRLAPGVKLVGVLGSYRLDTAAAAREREAENRIDMRIARDLGIRADRGEDDDGIQILIPAFLAGDTHVVLLDVVVPGPGKVADVSLRFKDLVRSKNGTARARLTLERSVSGRRGAAAARRAHSVRRSLLAHTLREALVGASDTEPSEALARIRRVEHVLGGLRGLDPAWAADADLAADLDLVRGYRALLEAAAKDGGADHQLLMTSMRYAGACKLLRIPPVDGP